MIKATTGLLTRYSQANGASSAPHKLRSAQMGTNSAEALKPRRAARLVRRRAVELLDHFCQALVIAQAVITRTAVESPRTRPGLLPQSPILKRSEGLLPAPGRAVDFQHASLTTGMIGSFSSHPDLKQASNWQGGVRVEVALG